jgi:hypothetical protein
MSKLIGYLHCPAQAGVQRGFEYAGAGEIWDLDEASIPLYAVGCDDYWITGKRPGTRVDSWFQNRLFGTCGSDNRNTQPQRGDIGVQYRNYEAAQLAAAGRITLSDDWCLVQTGTYPDSCGAKAGQPMYRIDRPRAHAA